MPQAPIDQYLNGISARVRESSMLSSPSESRSERCVVGMPANLYVLVTESVQATPIRSSKEAPLGDVASPVNNSPVANERVVMPRCSNRTTLLSSGVIVARPAYLPSSLFDVNVSPSSVTSESGPADWSGSCDRQIVRKVRKILFWRSRCGRFGWMSSNSVNNCFVRVVPRLSQ